MISPELASVLESGISVLVGTRDARLRPDCLRAAGVRASAADGTLTVFVPLVTGERALANLAENGRIAITVARAVDHRSLQVKGQVLEIRPATAGERREIERYLERLAVDWGYAGIPRATTQAMNFWPAATVTMRAEALFEQTPGPGAGFAMRPDSATASKAPPAS